MQDIPARPEPPTQTSCRCDVIHGRSLVGLFEVTPPRAREHLTNGARFTCVQNGGEDVGHRVVNIERWQLDTRNEIWGFARRLEMLENRTGLPEQQGVGILLPAPPAQPAA